MISYDKNYNFFIWFFKNTNLLFLFLKTYLKTKCQIIVTFSSSDRLKKQISFTCSTFLFRIPTVSHNDFYFVCDHHPKILPLIFDLLMRCRCLVIPDSKQTRFDFKFLFAGFSFKSL